MKRTKSTYKREVFLLTMDIILSFGTFHIAMLLTHSNLTSTDIILKSAPFILIRIIAFYFFGLYEYLWRYASVKALFNVSSAVTFSTLSILFLNFFLSKLIPISSIIVEWAFNLLAIGAFRFSLRVYREYLISLKPKDTTIEKRNLLIIGAGDAGEIVSREVSRALKEQYNLIGFVDDEKSKLGQNIHNKSILGSTKDIPKLSKKFNIQEAIIAIPSAEGKTIRKLVELCEQAEIDYKITPGLFEIIDGRVSVNKIREVKIEDLLGRKVVEADITEIKDLQNKTILVTGAGGSIGCELCRQIVKFSTKHIILLDHCEFAAYAIDKEIRILCENLNITITTVVADVKNRRRLKQIFEKNSIDMVFHAAAYKHVPLMECNIEEVVRNNILGTKNIIELAHEFKLEKFVLISTDKAVYPANAMGASKRICELILQQQAEKSDTTFAAVRFGNVLGSKGSVVPLFREQLQAGGPITITDFKMTRYFMTIPEAVRLVIQAGTLAKGGEIFILDMGEPVHILALAKDMVHLSGLELGKDIDIIETGLRPGEKLTEELMFNKEAVLSTSNQKIFIAQPFLYDNAQVNKDIAILIDISESGNDTDIKNQLMHVVNTTQPEKNIQDT